eukprot:693256-Prorocentrum_minimum.AAC.5
MNDKVNQITELTLFLLLLMLSVVGARLLECFRTLRITRKAASIITPLSSHETGAQSLPTNNVTTSA